MNHGGSPEASRPPIIAPAEVPTMRSALPGSQPVSDARASSAPVSHAPPMTPPAPRTSPTLTRGSARGRGRTHRSGRRRGASRATPGCRLPPRRFAGRLGPHVGPDPPRARRVDEDPVAAQFGGEDPGERVHRRFRDAVGRVTAAHVRELAHAGGQVDDPTAARAPHEGNAGDREPPRAEQVRLERLPRLVDVRVVAGDRRADDPRVVDEHVEAAEVLIDGLGAAVDARLVGRVELAGVDVTLQRLRRRANPRLVASAHDDRDSLRGQAARDLQPDPPVRAAHQRHLRHVRNATHR